MPAQTCYQATIVCEMTHICRPIRAAALSEGLCSGSCLGQAHAQAFSRLQWWPDHDHQSRHVTESLRNFDI